jgi:excisionase family DNA binding protein
VARLLGVEERFVRRLVAERRISYFKVGRYVRFDVAEVTAWLERQRVDKEEAASSLWRRTS